MIVDIKRQLYAWWCEVCGGSCMTDDWRYHHPAHTGRILIKSAENITDKNKKKLTRNKIMRTIMDRF